ncbi:type II secretion system F family protein [Georgenia sp. EYE_87]|uniref:type II secretion system F family protein n=1 Tax=Georgenia sp. EYE_87 TaxID=2853448 RepID=UPI002002A19B|nr:type II secretion system F family protein [Georgenia sp. EYE_87]MCK6208943.1 type II secretion system F family protein [Georgenia sp. EYE_87]
MPVSVAVGIAVISVALGLLVWTLVVGPDRNRQRALSNLNRGLNHVVLGQDGDVAPQARTGLESLARRLTAPGMVRSLEKLHARAGRPAAWSVDRLLVLKPVAALLAAFVTLLLVSSSASPLMVLIGSLATIVCYFLPELLLYSRGIERSEKITLELADTLDQMTIAVEAGLGFDAAMARAGKNGTGPLAEELVRTLQDIQMGQSRRRAFESLASRTDVQDLRRFIRAVIQADAYGIAIADVLRTQASEMRRKRRQRAEKKAMEIPIKVIFPLMMCILPVLFIVLMGPAAMDIVDAFSA